MFKEIKENIEHRVCWCGKQSSNTDRIENNIAEIKNSISVVSIQKYRELERASLTKNMDKRQIFDVLILSDHRSLREINPPNFWNKTGTFREKHDLSICLSWTEATEPHTNQ